MDYKVAAGLGLSLAFLATGTEARDWDRVLPQSQGHQSGIQAPHADFKALCTHLLKIYYLARALFQHFLR